MNKIILNTIALGALYLNGIKCSGVGSGHKDVSLYELFDSENFALYDSDGYKLLSRG